MSISAAESSALDQASQLQYGMLRRYGLALAWPELVPLVQTIYRERVAKLPWIPSSWLAGVQQLQSSRPEDLVVIAPCRLGNGTRSPNAPLFLDTAEKLDAWMKIWEDMSKGINLYAAARAEEGREEIESLQADAAFWDGAYKIAVFVRDAPSKAISAVGGGIADFLGSTIRNITGKSLWLWLLIAIGGVCALWLWISPASFLRVTRLGALLKLGKG